MNSGAIADMNSVRSRHYQWAALAVAAVAFAGFARSFYLQGLFHLRSLSAPVYIHGTIMSAWCVLFVVQASLVAGGKTHLHRRLGIVAALLAVVIVAWGAWLTVVAVAREGQQHIVGPFHYLLGVNLVNLSVFALLVATALGLRGRPAYHRRLMLLAAVTLLAPAVARIVLLFTHRPGMQFAVFYACVLACVLVDTIRHRRLHPAFGWGGLLTIAAFQLTFWLVQTNAYMNVVKREFG